MTSARFVVRGTHPTTIDVFGTLDGPAAPGFAAVVDALVRERHVFIDLRRADAVDDAGWQIVEKSLARLRAAGGTASVCPPLRVAAG